MVIKLRELAADTVDLMFNTLTMAQLEADVLKSELADPLLTAHQHWQLGEWDDLQPACINGIDLCTIWTGQQFSPIPDLLAGMLYALSGSGYITNLAAPEDSGRQAVRAFRKSREHLRHMFHAASDRFESVACLGLAAAYCKADRFGQAAHACAQGLALLPHEQEVGLGVEKLRERLKSLWMLARTLDTAQPQSRTV